MVFVKGQKIILREKRVEDAPDDYSWRTDEELARLDATRPLNMSYEAFLRYSKDELSHPGPWSKRLSIDTHEGTHIGNIMYYDVDLRKGETELGIMLDRGYWNQGYGTDSVNTLLDHLFGTMPAINRVYLHTLDWNQRARASFAKSGFQEVKPVRRSGFDFIQMEILRPEWEAIRRNQRRFADDGIGDQWPADGTAARTDE